MKKTATIALTLALLISLASCARTDISGITSLISGSETEKDNTASSTQEPDAELPVRGSSEGAVYENASLALGIKFDDEWTLYSDAQIATLNGLAEETLGEDYTEAVKNADMIYDLYAMRSDGSSMNIIFENMGIIYGSVMSESDYIDASVSQAETTFSQMNWTLESSEKVTVTAAEQEFNALELAVNIGSGYLYETLICKKIGNHMAVMTIASVDRSVIDGIIADFYKV